MVRKSDTNVELRNDAVTNRWSRIPATARPGMISAERSIQCPRNFTHPPGTPSSISQTEDDDGVVGHVSDTP